MGHQCPKNGVLPIGLVVMSVGLFGVIAFWCPTSVPFCLFSFWEGVDKIT